MSNWYDRSQYNEYRPEFEYGHHQFYDHGGNSSWERQPFQGYGSYHGEPNYYPHTNWSYEQENQEHCSTGYSFLETSPDYDISEPFPSLEETQQRIERTYKRLVAMNSSKEECTRYSEMINESGERISVMLSEIQARLEAENEQLANAARNNLNFQNRVSNSTLDINSEYLPNLEDEARIKDTTYLDKVQSSLYYYDDEDSSNEESEICRHSDQESINPIELYNDYIISSSNPNNFYDYSPIQKDEDLIRDTTVLDDVVFPFDYEADSGLEERVYSENAVLESSDLETIVLEEEDRPVEMSKDALPDNNLEESIDHFQESNDPEIREIVTSLSRDTENSR